MQISLKVKEDELEKSKQENIDLLNQLSIKK